MKRKVEGEHKVPGGFGLNLKRIPDLRGRMSRRLTAEGRTERQMAVKGDSRPDVPQVVFEACQENHSFGEVSSRIDDVFQVEEVIDVTVSPTEEFEVVSLEALRNQEPTFSGDHEFSKESWDSYLETAEDLRS